MESESTVCILRKKLGIRPGDNRYIVNELGVDYCMPLEKA